MTHKPSPAAHAAAQALLTDPQMPMFDPGPGDPTGATAAHAQDVLEAYKGREEDIPADTFTTLHTSPLADAVAMLLSRTKPAPPPQSRDGWVLVSRAHLDYLSETLAKVGR